MTTTEPNKSHADISDSTKHRLKKGYEGLVQKTKEMYSGAEEKSAVWFEEAQENSRQALQRIGTGFLDLVSSLLEITSRVRFIILDFTVSTSLPSRPFFLTVKEPR
jgi:phage-related protein